MDFKTFKKFVKDTKITEEKTDKEIQSACQLIEVVNCAAKTEVELEAAENDRDLKKAQIVKTEEEVKTIKLERKLSVAKVVSGIATPVLGAVLYFTAIERSGKRHDRSELTWSKNLEQTEKTGLDKLSDFLTRKI